MAAAEVKNFDSPDETRPFEGKGKADVVQLAGRTIGRGEFEPGWRWSECVKPVAGTDNCQVRATSESSALEFESGSAEEYARG